ncbi:universal stress protein [Thalassococcus sp. BH17M4-6]|uniref:universal stress protein n=1 Tax=Thalassococcus sp. BH17M4-6 TaxID=3413148 RepID=UPI003BEE19F3
MSGKFVVGFDDSSPARRALDFALDKAKKTGGTIIVAHVMEWSPYSFLTPEELEERHKRRKEEIKRAETAVMGAVTEKLQKSGVTFETVIKYGHIAEKLCDIAKEHGATQMVVGRDGNSALVSRVFGSVAGTLVQIAPVPCTIVP